MNVIEAVTRSGQSAELDRAHHTARAYRRGMSVFLDFLSSEQIQHTEPIEKVTIDHFINVVEWLMQRQYSKRTLHVYLAGIKYLMDWMVMRGFICPDYRDTIRIKMALEKVNRKREKLLPRMPLEGGVERMIDAAKSMDEETPRLERNIALILFLATTGCRNNEVAQLKIKDISLTERKALVVGKGSKERYVFFSKETAVAIKQYWVYRGFRAPDDPVFARHDRGTGQKHQHLTTKSIRDIAASVAVMAGIDPEKFTPHFFRHAFATKVLRQTGNLAAVQELLGHADPSYTRVYAKVTADDLRNVYAKAYG